MCFSFLYLNIGRASAGIRTLNLETSFLTLPESEIYQKLKPTQPSVHSIKHNSQKYTRSLEFSFKNLLRTSAREDQENIIKTGRLPCMKGTPKRSQSRLPCIL